MEKMVGKENAPSLKWSHHINAPPTTNIWENDVEMLGLHRKSTGFSHYVKWALPWLGFGVLCVLLGGLFVHMYLTKPINAMELHQPRHQYMQDEDYIRSFPNEQVPVFSHMTKEKDQSELIDIVKAVLQNANHDKETKYMHEEKETQSLENHQNTLNFTKGKVADIMLQECGDVSPDKVFPDIDYALYGYDSLKGYPLAIGHDPGYTLPIFKAEYTAASQSGDCRYSVPEGLAVVPDISCVTSFSSKTVTTHNEFMNSLAISAGVEAGGWGMSFSMSAAYNTMSSQLENEEKVFIMSSAECKYYFCKIESTSPPGFTDGFIKWVKKLDKSSKEIDVMEFFDKYGTHFIVESEFGARYTYQYSMTSKELEKKKEQHVNVEMSASYSGLFSLGAKFGLDSEQTSMAQDFMKDIDIKTYTVGAAPPAGGDATEWASTVSEDPVPVHYKLDSMENLFTETYMSQLPDINYNKIYGDIVRNKHKYQRYLKYKALYGDSRAREHNYVPFFESTLSKYAYQEVGVLLSDCIDDCINDPKCIAISRQSNLCNFYHGEGSDNHLAAGDRGKSYTTYLLWKKGDETFRLDDTTFSGTAMRSIPGLSQADCEKRCLLHERCFGITYVSKSCEMFQQFQIDRLISDTVSHAKSVIVPSSPSPELYLGYSL